MASRVAETPPIAVLPAPSWWRRVVARVFPISNAPGEIPAMDGLRAIAISLVFFYHVRGAGDKFTLTWFGGIDATFITAFGQMGVLLFFVLSGFLLFTPYARAIVYDKPRLPSLLEFYRRRAMRILPAYWTSVILIAFLVNDGGWLWLKRLWHVISHLTFLYTFSPDTLHSLNGVFWSLGIEVQFYILMPFLAWAMLHLGRRIGAGRAVAGVIGLILALSLVWRWWFAVVLDQQIINQPGDYRFWLDQLPSLLIIFALGMGCSYIWVATNKRDADRAASGTLRQGFQRAILASFVGLLGLAAIVYSTAFGNGAASFYVMAGKRDMLNRVGWDILVGFGWAAIVIAVLLGFGWLRRILSLWPLRALALVSYSFYIWHDIINSNLNAYIREQYGGAEPLPALLLVLFPLCFLFALGYFHLVELPYLRRKKPTPPAP